MAIDIKDYPNKITTGLWGNRDYTVFYYSFTYNKKKYRGLINYRDKTAWNKRTRVDSAQSRLGKLKEDKRDGIDDGRITLDRYFYDHYALLDDSTWNKTLKSHYKRYIAPALGGKQLSTILNSHIKGVIKEQKDKGLSPRTVKQTVEALAPVFKDALVNRLIIANPLDGISIKLPKTKKMVSHGSLELKRIYEAICEEFADDAFYKAFYLLALQGRRKSEIMTLELNDVSFEHNYYILRNPKNGEEQKMYLPDEIGSLMLSFVEQKNRYVFTSYRTGSHIVNIEKVTNRLKKRLGKRFTLHYTRNVVVSAMAERGESSVHMSGALGHNNTNTLDKYLSINYSVGSKVASDTIESLIKD